MSSTISRRRETQRVFDYTDGDERELRAALAAADEANSGTLSADHRDSGGNSGGRCTGHLLTELTTVSPNDGASTNGVFLYCSELAHLEPETLAKLNAYPPLGACGRLNLKGTTT